VLLLWILLNSFSGHKINLFSFLFRTITGIWPTKTSATSIEPVWKQADQLQPHVCISCRLFYSGAVGALRCCPTQHSLLLQMVSVSSLSDQVNISIVPGGRSLGWNSLKAPRRTVRSLEAETHTAWSQCNYALIHSYQLEMWHRFNIVWRLNLPMLAAHQA
jgi:hypothetical protein